MSEPVGPEDEDPHAEDADATDPCLSALQRFRDAIRWESAAAAEKLAAAAALSDLLAAEAHAELARAPRVPGQPDRTGSPRPRWSSSSRPRPAPPSSRPARSPRSPPS